MTDLWDDSRTWISLHVATTWLIDLRQVRTLAASGTLELGRDPANGLFLNRSSLKRCIVPLSPTEGGLTLLWARLSQRPPLWVFGHFHRIHKRTVSGTRFVCIGSSDGSDGFKGVRSVLLDTERRSVTILSAPQPAPS